LAFFGWPGIARVVRGQILFAERTGIYGCELRLQDCLFPEEYSGILSQNVIPQLIVYVAMSLGGIITYRSNT
jgi:ABC-type dipeptide/oligopeptide/nickel transport system permease subunit